MTEELAGCSLADVLEKLEKGKIGHRAAMAWLNVESFEALVEIMHVNGRLMPGHQPMRVAPATVALVRSITRPALAGLAEGKVSRARRRPVLEREG